MHFHCLHWLMSTGLLFQSAFCWPWIYEWWNGTNVGIQFVIGDLIWFPLSAYVCLGFVVEYWPFVGACRHHSHSKLYRLCHLASLFYPWPPHTPHHCALPTHPLYTILMNFMIFFKKPGKNQPLSTCQVSCNTEQEVHMVFFACLQCWSLRPICDCLSKHSPSQHLPFFKKLALP